MKSKEQKAKENMFSLSDNKQREKVLLKMVSTYHKHTKILCNLIGEFIEREGSDKKYSVEDSIKLMQKCKEEALLLEQELWWLNGKRKC